MGELLSSVTYRAPAIFRMLPRNRIARRVLNAVNSRFLRIDRRTTFRDLARIDPSQRRAASPVINFYSSVHNIGNYLPLLGIHGMLGADPDVWNIHHKGLDFEFVNRNYRAAIIGGAGLLERGFEPFWERFARECRIPAIVWGVGTCAPDRNGSKGVDPSIFARAAPKCALINVRDDLTAEYYGLRDASITPCPTIVYVEHFLQASPKRDGFILYASHEELLDRQEKDLIHERLRSSLGEFRMTDNIQRPLEGLEDIIRNYYCRSRLVITTRLHGAIIAYGLGIPYVAIPRDEKLRAFHRLYGNGRLLEDTTLLREAVEAPIAADRKIQVRRSPCVRPAGQRMACDRDLMPADVMPRPARPWNLSSSRRHWRHALAISACPAD